MDFEPGPFVADLLYIYTHIIVALCFTDLKSVLIIPYFSNPPGANAAKMYLSYFGEGVRFRRLVLPHKDVPWLLLYSRVGVLTLL